MFPRGRALDGAVRQRFGKWLGEPDDSVTCAAQRRVNAENNLMGVESRGNAAIENWRGDSFVAGKPVFDLRELLRSNAHAPDCARHRRRAKSNSNESRFARMVLLDLSERSY